MSRSDRDRLLDVLEAGAAIAEHLQRGPLSDGLVLDAVRVRLIETGEAVKDVSPELLNQQPSILWRRVGVMPSQLVHRCLDTRTPSSPTPLAPIPSSCWPPLGRRWQHSTPKADPPHRGLFGSCVAPSRPLPGG